MRQNAATAAKAEIVHVLKTYLQVEGIVMEGADIVKYTETTPPRVRLKSVEDLPLKGSPSQWEICLMLEVLGASWQCDALVDGIYAALHPHRLALGDLTVALMSFQVEIARAQTRAIIRYVFG